MSPRDFLDETQQNISGPNVGISGSSPRDFLEEHEEPKESFGIAARNAIPIIGTDILNNIYQGIQNLPNRYNQAQTEIPGALNTLIQHPIHATGQGLAGLAEFGRNVFNTPHDIINYAANRLNLIPKDINQMVQMGRMPEDTQQIINQWFGQPKYPGEELLRGLPRNVANIAGGISLARAMPPLTKFGATRTLNKARQLAEGRDIGSLNVNPELIEDARQFLPNTLPHRNALEAAQSGDYNNLFKLQSDVGKNASDYAKSLFSAAERSHGRAGLEARNRLLDAIHENLQSQGHQDISNLLREGQSDYRRYMAFKPYRNILGLALLGAALPKNSLTNIASKIWSHKTQ